MKMPVGENPTITFCIGGNADAFPTLRLNIIARGQSEQPEAIYNKFDNLIKMDCQAPDGSRNDCTPEVK